MLAPCSGSMSNIFNADCVYVYKRTRVATVYLLCTFIYIQKYERVNDSCLLHLTIFVTLQCVMFLISYSLLCRYSLGINVFTAALFVYGVDC